MAAPDLTFTNNNPPQCGADSLNAFTQEINNIIDGMGITPSDSNYDQAINAVLKAAVSGTFYEYSGTANAIILTKLGGRNATNSYYDGMRAGFIATADNTGATTVNIDGLGVKNIKTVDGGDLVGGEITGFGEIVYRSGDDYFTIAVSSQIVGASRNDEIIKLILNNDLVSVYPTLSGTYASVSGSYNTVPADTTHLIINDGSKNILVELSTAASGTITALDSSAKTATIGGTDVDLYISDLASIRNYALGFTNVWQAAELTDTGATFTDGTASYRAVSVTYTNTKDIPIMVAISIGSTTGVSNAIFVDGVSIAQLGEGTTISGSITFPFSFIVPPGSTYYAAVGPINYWSEFR